MPINKGEIRGLVGRNGRGDSKSWLAAVSHFPNGVPRFDSRAACLEFMKNYNTQAKAGSNPDFQHLMHIFTMLVNWEQIENYLLPEIVRARLEPSNSAADAGNDVSDNNIYEADESKQVVEDIEFRLNQPFHKCTNPQSTMNTLKYLFYHMKCGIFVMIRNGNLRIFAPFVNSDYHNNWGDIIKLEADDTIDSYYSKKSGLYREENVEHDRFKWWANGNIICNELSQSNTDTQFWGDHFLAPLRDMLEEACRLRKIPDCEFFLNKRDYPQLKVNVDRGVPVEVGAVFVFGINDFRTLACLVLVIHSFIIAQVFVPRYYFYSPTKIYCNSHTDLSGIRTIEILSKTLIYRSSINFPPTHRS